MSGMCPCCGYNLTADTPLERGTWRLSLREVYYGDTLLPLTEQQVATLYAIARAAPRTITANAILNRVTDKDNVNLVAVLVHRIRRHLEAAGVPDPIATTPGRGGYFWKDCN